MNHNNNKSLDTDTDIDFDSKAVLKSIQVLHPSRYYSNYSYCNSHENTGSTTCSTFHASVNNNSKQRFSTLLLEYGEREIYDWAVVASSTSSTVTVSTINNISNISSSSLSSSVLKKKYSNNQANGISRNKINNSHSNNKNGAANNGNYNSNSRKKSLSKSAALAAAQGTNAMKRIQGRMHLCTKSIVFEPDDVSRGVMRFPFDKMTVKPALSSSSSPSGSSSDWNYQMQQHHQPESKTISFTTTKYIIMKKNNIITPFTIVDELLHYNDTNNNINTNNNHNANNNANGIKRNQKKNDITTTTFSFTFLYTKPSHFFSIYENIQSSSSPSSTTMPFKFTVPKFNTLNFVHLSEMPQTTSLQSYILTPLSSEPGCTMITQDRFYFQPMQGQGILGFGGSSSIGTGNDADAIDNSTSSSHVRVFSWKLTSIIATARRYHGLKDSALELFFGNVYHENHNTMSLSSGRDDDGGHSSSLLIAFESMLDRELVMSLLPTVRFVNDTKIGDYRTATGTTCGDVSIDQKKRSLKIFCHTDTTFIQQAMQGWMNGVISNFDYLLALNSAAGRSFHDLSRYPVFPWVLNDYESSKLDWNDINVFRDLTKPIGALNQERLEQFQQRLNSMKDMDDVTSFLYGTHYSAPGYCLYYLVRLMPEHMLCLQNGQFLSSIKLKKIFLLLSLAQTIFSLSKCLLTYYYQHRKI